MNITDELKHRFDEKWEADGETGCWNWIASCAGMGYGQIKLPGTRKQIYAHRLSYLIHNGEIPEERYVCHTCDNPKCVNPNHLFIGTQKENLQDMKRKNRHLSGEKNGSAVLTAEKVVKIKKMLAAGISQTDIAKLFGVHQVTISKISRGLLWSHITLTDTEVTHERDK